MELNNQIKLSKHIFRLLKVNEIIFPIGRTNKGNLGLKFNESNEDFEIYLDSVPLSTKSILEDENNIELKKMIEKYWFNPELVTSFYKGDFHGIGKGLEKIVNNGTTTVTVGKIVDKTGNDKTDEFLGKKRGRPVGSKNKHGKNTNKKA